MQSYWLYGKSLTTWIQLTTRQIDVLPSINYALSGSHLTDTPDF